MGIRTGRSADQLSRDVRIYLKDPELLFRRVRDEHGQLQLSKAARAMHPGRGVYRSSYKNALRLTATETNMAYRTADHERWQQLDFVVGIEIHLSNNHPVADICDDLKGKYPKDFKFVGWHPNCRCHATSILKTMEEMIEDDARLDRGEELTDASANRVNDVPDNYKEWCSRNADKIVEKDINKMPYFVRDNYSETMYATGASYKPIQITRKDAEFLKREFHITEKQANVLMSDPPADAQDRVRRLLSENITHSVFQYAEIYESRNKGITTLLSEAERLKGIDEISRVKIINNVKLLCAEECRKDLEKWGVTSGLNFAGTNMNYEFSREQVLPSGLRIKELKKDLVLFKDGRGLEYAYPIGVQKDGILFSASDASKIVQTMPEYLIKNVRRVSFIDNTCPYDAYFEMEYNRIGHKSAATDGGDITFWLPSKGSSKSEFFGYMCHEGGHSLDGAHKLTKKAAWVNAVRSDVESAIARNAKWLEYPTEYAKVSLAEDFAESIRLYVLNPDLFKQQYPNRAAFIEFAVKNLPNG